MKMWKDLSHAEKLTLNSPNNEKQGQDDFMDEFAEHLREN